MKNQSTLNCTVLFHADKDQATVCDRSVEKHLVLLSGIVPGGCLLLVNLGLLCIIIYLICLNNKKVSVKDIN